MTTKQIEEKARELANKQECNGMACWQCKEYIAMQMAEWLLGNIWHNGKLEKPKTSEIFYVSDERGCGVADYDADMDRFDAVDECYYSGGWNRCHIKQWAYLEDILPMEGGKQ